MNNFIFYKDSKPKLEDVEKFEKTLGAMLPNEYREYLLNFGGGAAPAEFMAFKYGIPGKLSKNEDYGEALLEYLSSCIIEKNGNSELIEHYHYMNSVHRENNFLPSNMIVIGSSPGGNNILLGISGEEKAKIYFWDVNLFPQEDDVPETHENISFIANSFAIFLDSLYEYKE